MSRRLKIFCLATAVCLSLSIYPISAFANSITMGTGGVQGVYYPVGQALAKQFNAKNQGPEIKVSSSQGSVQNIADLISGKVGLAIVQADIADKAFNGKLPFQKGNPYKSLRAVMSLHMEQMTVLACQGSGIKKLTDLKGKRVAVGKPGSGTFQNTKLALSVVGMTYKDLGKVYHIGGQEAAAKFQDGKLDAIFYFVGNPNKYIKRLCKSNKVRIRFISIPNVIDKILVKNKYYSTGYVSKVFYPNSLNRIGAETFGIKAVLVTDSKSSNKMIKCLLGCVFDNFKKFKSQHKALMMLKTRGVAEGMSIPLHPAAKAFFKTKGF